MFLTIPLKTRITLVEMLPKDFYSQNELDEIKRLPDFYTWSNYGYLSKKMVRYINEEEY